MSDNQKFAKELVDTLQKTKDTYTSVTYKEDKVLSIFCAKYSLKDNYRSVHYFVGDGDSIFDDNLDPDERKHIKNPTIKEIINYIFYKENTNEEK